jgi:hypothetical protein
MNRADFETELRAQGYREIVDRRMDAKTTNLGIPMNSMRACWYSKAK